ncbi:hypothetical protein Plec18170_000298 [Paecilomyces lecythidis]
MSLITDRALLALWTEAQQNPSSEWASVALWTHLWAKYIFWERDWLVSTESPPESAGLRRVDVVIKYLGGNNSIAVLAFHEAKPPDAGPQDTKEVEEQALDACRRYLSKPDNAELSFVYAVTTLGTKARAWIYEREPNSLRPMFRSQNPAERAEYVEVHSTDAAQLKTAFNVMRNVKPYE